MIDNINVTNNKYMQKNFNLGEIAETIADLVFKKLVDKQEEWDKEFADDIKKDVLETTKRNSINKNIQELEESLKQAEKSELYTVCEILRNKIVELKSQI